MIRVLIFTATFDFPAGKNVMSQKYHFIHHKESFMVALIV